MSRRLLRLFFSGLRGGRPASSSTISYSWTPASAWRFFSSSSSWSTLLKMSPLSPASAVCILHPTNSISLFLLYSNLDIVRHVDYETIGQEFSNSTSMYSTMMLTSVFVGWMPPCRKLSHDSGLMSLLQPTTILCR